MTEAPLEVAFLGVTPQFTVPDLVQTTLYYRDVLGFKILGYWDGERVNPEGDTSAVFAIVRRDAVEIFFSRAEGPEVRTGCAEGACDAYFRVTGVDALAIEWKGRGVEIMDGPENRSYGQRELVIVDCNGLVFAFGEVLAVGA
ncbi:MAG: VOC family protein [Arenimonas sp.]